MMNAALGHLAPLQLVLYMDDLCILSGTFEVHLERLERTFIALRQHGFRLNARKCQFCMRERDRFLWSSCEHRWFESGCSEN